MGVQGTPQATGFPESVVEIPISATCNIGRMDIRVAALTGAAYQATATLYKNGVSTGFSCASGTTNGTANNATAVTTCTPGSTLTITAGDTIAYQISANISYTSGRVAVGMQCQ
jgi:hypothetical protein